MNMIRLQAEEIVLQELIYSWNAAPWFKKPWGILLPKSSIPEAASNANLLGICTMLVGCSAPNPDYQRERCGWNPISWFLWLHHGARDEARLAPLWGQGGFIMEPKTRPVFYLAPWWGQKWSQERSQTGSITRPGWLHHEATTAPFWGYLAPWWSLTLYI